MLDTGLTKQCFPAKMQNTKNTKEKDVLRSFQYKMLYY